MLKIAWSELYQHPLPPNHRFPMEKYSLLPEQLIYEGTITKANLFAPKMLAEDQILRVHDSTYWKRLRDLELSKKEIRRSGFPLSKSLVNRELNINSGTLEATAYAFQFGVAMNIAGGTHHAFTDRAEGFCLLNDIAIAAQHLIDQKELEQILVVDLDVHQGNGTAQIFKDENRVFTFSMHGAKNYPHQKEVSDLDIDLPDGTDDKTYLKTLNQHLPKLIERLEPDFIFFQSGVDVLETDKLGRLSLSIEGCRKRDQLVFELCKSNDIPVVASMGGGYSHEIKHIIEAHSNTYRVATELYF